jgi:hypothetical protein
MSAAAKTAINRHTYGAAEAAPFQGELKLAHRSFSGVFDARRVLSVCGDMFLAASVAASRPE